ncbi:MAG TPA: biotin/lipoyl-containing protein [Fibrobacteria bacterium]|nr:biotin/lipoyl-containing protein [Fibrobacteria bacterium]
MKKLRITVEGKTYEVVVETMEDPSARAARVATPTRAAASAPSSVSASTAPAAKAAGGSASSIRSQLAGRIVSVDVKEGDMVQPGVQLLVLEAMKMNTPVASGKAGKVTKIHVSEGETVEEGAALLDVE